MPTAGRVKPGSEVKILNLSRAGALIEGSCRFRPGATVTFSCGIVRGGAAITCRVVRCQVSHVGGPDGLRYQAGLAFEEPLAVDSPPGPSG